MHAAMAAVSKAAAIARFAPARANRDNERPAFTSVGP